MDCSEKERYKLFKMLKKEFTCDVCKLIRIMCNSCDISFCPWCEYDWFYRGGYRPIPYIDTIYGEEYYLCRACFCWNCDCKVVDDYLELCSRHLKIKNDNEEVDK